MHRRNLGLDMVRTISILLVIVSHSKFFFIPHVQDRTVLYNLSIFGLYAVEMFFALSGFLIGQILLTEVAPCPDKAHIVRFYLRRWLRTLPAYYFILIILVILTHWFTTDQSWHLRHFVFMQNFSEAALDFFGVSWTLSIEEWFYLFSPLVFAFFLRRPEHARTHLPWLLATAIVLFPLARLLYVQHFDPSWDVGVRKYVPLRFDALLIGIFIPWIKLYYPRLYQRLARPDIFFLCIAGLIGIAAYFATGFPSPGQKVLNTSLFARVWSFSLISFFLSCSLPFCEQSSFINERLYNFSPTRILFSLGSRYAYMIYLIHFEVFRVLFPLSTSVTSGALLLIGALLFSVPMAVLCHHYFEKPIMDLRDRLPPPYC